MNDEFEDLKGKTLISFILNEDKDEIYLKTECGKEYKIYHNQNCCECVYVNEIIGDIKDILESKILLAEEVINEQNRTPSDAVKYIDECFTWTFYKINTIKGGITIRWYGGSNGYYSERVNFIKVSNEN